MDTDHSSLQTLNVDIIIPVFNEEEALRLFHAQLLQVLDELPHHFRLFYVNDGSSDGTQNVLENLCAADERVLAVELSRNFGHQAALSAGLDQADGDYVISMDGDGQHPPQMIPEMIKLAQSGYDIVLTQRQDALETGFFKRWTSQMFYRLVNRIGNTRILPGGADFRLISGNVLKSLKNMPEYHRFLRGMVAWMGYRTVILPFSPPERLAGKSKYSLRKMLKLSMDAIFSFSLVPLYIGVSMGGVFLLLALIEAVYVLSFWVSGNTSNLAPGWSSLMFVLLFVGGSLMITLGFIGIYIGYIYQEVKGRPVYLIRQIFKKHSKHQEVNNSEEV